MQMQQDRGLKRIWDRLYDRFANPEVVESAIKRNLAKFPKLGTKDNAKLYKLLDIVSEIDFLKENPTYSTLLAYFDLLSGVNPIVSKLPHYIQQKWVTKATNYKLRNGLPYPKFPVFVAFLEKIARIKNDPSQQFDTEHDSNKGEQQKVYPAKLQSRRSNSKVTAFKTQVQNSGTLQKDRVSTRDRCPIHENSKHTLNKCRSFRSRPIDQRKTFMKENGYCFHCCGQKKHTKSKCHETVLCSRSVCKTSDHHSALHKDFSISSVSDETHEGEKLTVVSPNQTRICGKPSNTSKSRAKIVKAVVYSKHKLDRARHIYCVIIDQSSNTLATSIFLNRFGEYGPDHQYTLKSCSGDSVNKDLIKVCGNVIESCDGSQVFSLPDIIQCTDIPQNRSEIPSPEVTASCHHLSDITDYMPTTDDQISIKLLICRDLIETHVVLDQRVGTTLGQRLPLRWALIGNSCVGTVHKQTTNKP